MIKLAKLNEKQLTDLTQVIYYGDMETNEDWKLLELNGPLLKAIEEGQVLAFKGIRCWLLNVSKSLNSSWFNSSISQFILWFENIHLFDICTKCILKFLYFPLTRRFK